MAITENRVITTYVANVDQEKRALDDLIRKIDQLKGKEMQAADAREGHFDQLVLDLTRSNNAVEDSVVSWDGLNKSGNTFGSVMGNAGKAVQGVAKAMAPWNQAVELAGKAVRFANEGLDAYAKTSADAAYEVNKLKQEFAGYEQAIMAATGKIALELLKPAMSFDEIRKSMVRVQNTELYKRLYGPTKDLGFFGEDESKDFWGAGTLGLGSVDEGTAFTFLDGVNKRLDTYAAKVKAAADARKNAKSAVADLIGQRSTDYDFDVSGSNVLGSAAFQNYRGFAIDEQKLLEQVTAGHMADYESLQSAGSRYEKFQDKRQQGLLEGALGPIEQFDAYAQAAGHLGDAFSAFGDAVGASYEAIVTGQGSVSAAFKKMFADGLLAMGKSSAVEALRETALGFGSLALGPLGGVSASMHFKAAAMHGGVALAAGLAARAMSGGDSGPRDHRGGDAGGRGESGSVSTDRGRDQRGDAASRDRSSRPIVMILGSQFDELTPRQRRQKADEAWERARRERDE
jgi:hypothetical protein